VISDLHEEHYFSAESPPSENDENLLLTRELFTGVAERPQESGDR